MGDTAVAEEVQPSVFVTLEDAIRAVDDRAAGHGDVISSEKWIRIHANDSLTAKHRQKVTAMRKLGVSFRAAQFCERVAPGGRWILTYTELPHSQRQYMAYYSRYLPYALGMCQCETDFPYDGIDQETIYCLFKSFMGFVDLGLGLHMHQNNHDCELFSECYEKCNELFPPSLPFDEAINPASVFAYIQNREWFVKNVVASPTDRRLTVAINVYNALRDRGSSHIQQLIKPFDRTST